MKRIFSLVIMVGSFSILQAQSLKEKLGAAAGRLAADSQMQHGLLGFHVADAVTGEEIFSLNGRVGLAPASTQKIVTAIAALDLLGKDYRFKTEMGYTGELDDEQLKGDLCIKAYGDPSLGSWRYTSSKSAVVFDKILDYLRRFRVKKITGDLVIDISAFEFQPLPVGWTWEDMGNYYGAGNWALNWRENQYDLLLKPGQHAGDSVAIVGTSPEVYNQRLANKLVTGKPRSGDNAYIFNPPYATEGFVAGTYEGGSKISGALTNAPRQFGLELAALLAKNHISLEGTVKVITDKNDLSPDVFFAHHSPAMDSLVYWFMRRSINLYGEALVKTIGLEKTGTGSLDSGLAVIKRHFSEKQLALPAELRIIDGSGLSPSNRLTAEALVKLLIYAKKQSWYPEFQASFPEFNNMRLKSGTIRGAKSFSGIHEGRDGRKYAVAIILNNYDGTSGSIVAKMYKLLDLLK